MGQGHEPGSVRPRLTGDVRVGRSWAGPDRPWRRDTLQSSQVCRGCKFVGADAYPTLLAAVAGEAMRTSLHRWLATDSTASLPDLVDEAWDLLAAGLPAPRG